MSLRALRCRNVLLVLLTVSFTFASRASDEPPSSVAGRTDASDVGDGEAARPLTHFQPRYGHTVTVSTDGHILIAGGGREEGLVDWAETFDPRTRRFARTGRLNQPRTDHQALALPDGSVVVAGGMAATPQAPRERAANHPEVWEPVSGTWKMLREIRFEADERAHMGLRQDGSVLFLASREAGENEAEIPGAYRAWIWNVASGRVEPRSVEVAPRAGAGIAILPDGRVLFAGGARVEFFPGYSCAEGRDGQLAGEEAAGEERGDCKDEPAGWYGIPLDSAEIWDSRSGAVTAIDPLPHLWWMGSPVTRVLRNGSVVMARLRPLSPYADGRSVPLLWEAGSGKWRELPAITDGRDPASLVELADGTLAIRSGRLPPGAAAWSATPPLQDVEARLAELASGELLSISTTGVPLAIHDTQTGQWELPAVTVQPPPWSSGPTLLPLADGRLMVVAHVPDARPGGLGSFIWSPSDGLWRKGGRLKTMIGTPGQAIQLPSGRVLHLGRRDDHLVCETALPDGRDWQSCKNFVAEKVPDAKPRPWWEERSIALELLDDGRAIVLGHSEAFIFDEETLGWARTQVEWGQERLPFGTPVRPARPDAQVLDPRTGQWLDATAASTRYRELNHNGSPPRLFWNRERRHWEYAFDQTSPMGTHGMRLPDGCIASWRKDALAVFDPAAGLVTTYPAQDFSTDVPDGRTVLKDGTAVAVSTGGGDGAFKTRRIACNGFVTAAGQEATGSAPVPEERVEPASRAVPRASSPPRPAGAALWEYRWIALAIAGPAVFYALVRLLGRLLRRHEREQPAGDGPARPQVGSRGFRRTLRVILYGVALALALPLIANILIFKAVDAVEDSCVRKASGCLDAETGILRPVAALAREQTGADHTRIPCEYVGSWSYGRARKAMRIELQESGRYQLTENKDGTKGRAVDRGYWAVQGDNMLWRTSDPRVEMEVDVNSILAKDDAAFELQERDGSHTRFELIARGECSR
ncbi:Kelch repeat-containing protein [Pseudothauera rhizosphaerae]|uniref:Kelch motif-containing protein n=1 Tax=Pseudothauera rhizosphaerae TaxID=2565932 RepID=A0A4S4AEX4_9RHOO|nr:kelch repeat-containing protein [Pseudothauera rhizosphaerae]THF57708.1 hypothetical protein E6O51_17935 [Pseudothauera rhizosphaerae]